MVWVLGFELGEVGLFGGGKEVSGDVLCVAAARGGFDVNADVVGVGECQNYEILGVGEVEAERIWCGWLDEFGAAVGAGGELPVFWEARKVAGEDCADECAGYQVAVAVGVAQKSVVLGSFCGIEEGQVAVEEICVVCVGGAGDPEMDLVLVGWCEEGLGVHFGECLVERVRWRCFRAAFRS